MATTNAGVRVIRVSPRDRIARFFTRKTGMLLLGTLALSAIVFISTFTYFYLQYSKLIDKKLRGGPFASTSRIFASPQMIATGDVITPTEVVSRLRRSGYNESRSNRTGWFTVKSESVEIFPGPESVFAQEAGVIDFVGGKISRIVSLSDNTPRNQYMLEPQLITNLYDRNREKRRLVKYDEIPEVLVHAVISVEDKRFFQHVGFDPIGIIRAAYVDVKDRRNAQGASTLSQQLARGMFLKPEKSFGRKIEELMITLVLEQKLSKKEIFEFYCNQIDLGHKGSFTIRGFGEAAEAYFGKSLRSVSPAEAATLAGMVQRPSYFNPYRHGERIVDRRNIVLSLMRQNGYLDDRQYGVAQATPLKLASNGAGGESSESAYFVDLLHDELQSKFQDYDFQSQAYRVYSSLDIDLQRAANDAVRAGMASVDEQLRKQKRFKGMDVPEPQVALIALDPHTGQIKAIVGGRNYGTSQLNHILAKRQPGSIFKPWVYAAAMNTGIAGGPRTLTPATTLVDEPTTFWFDGKPYEPGNFKHEYYGVTTLRKALAHSMNIAAVKVAEMVGYQAVVNLAKKAGLNEDIRATPAVALGSYDATPLEMAGSYTVFANKGVYVRPTFVSEIKGSDGSSIYEEKPETKSVLDPRVNYLMVSLLEEVMRSGTAAGVRGRGFTVPAGGKTGTSRDGWFAGFTSELLCVVWVGFDDNRELDLEGAHSALPIWTDFMKRALLSSTYRNAKPFLAPDGIVTIKIDPESGMPATAFCPTSRAEVFISGTEPVGSCPLHGGGTLDNTQVSGWDTSAPVTKPASPTPPLSMDRRVKDPLTDEDKPVTLDEQPPPKKKGLLKRIFGKGGL